MNNTIPMPIKVQPFDHQQQAYDFVCDLFGLTTFEEKCSGAGLLMEMGCGKSLVGLAVMGTLSRLSLIDRALIVCPLSITGVWESELEKFADYPYSLTILKGTMQKKKEQLASLPNSDLQIVVCNYESMWRLEAELQKFHPGLIIADEGHRLKDGTSRQSKAMHRLGDKADYRLLLTGTAITNKELDIYSEYRFTAPQVFGRSFYAFRGRYFYMGGYGGYVPIFKKEMMDDFLKRLHSVSFRVRKDECLDLPEITEEVRIVDLEPKALRLYSEIEEESYAELKNSEVTAMNILTRILRLSQITGGHLTDDENTNRTVSTAKLTALSDILDTMQEENRKLVVKFSSFDLAAPRIWLLHKRCRLQSSVLRIWANMNLLLHCNGSDSIASFCHPMIQLVRVQFFGCLPYTWRTPFLPSLLLRSSGTGTTRCLVLWYPYIGLLECVVVTCRK